MRNKKWPKCPVCQQGCHDPQPCIDAEQEAWEDHVRCRDCQERWKGNIDTLNGEKGMNKDRAKQIWDRINEADDYLSTLQEYISQRERDNYGVNLILETKGCLDILRELLTDKVMVQQKCGHHAEIRYCRGLDLREVIDEFEGIECVTCRTDNFLAKMRNGMYELHKVGS